jgi:hypothetical protein
VKIRKGEIHQQDSSWFTARIEDPKAVADVCLRACRHGEDSFMALFPEKIPGSIAIFADR